MWGLTKDLCELNREYDNLIRVFPFCKIFRRSAIAEDTSIGQLETWVQLDDRWSAELEEIDRNGLPKEAWIRDNHALLGRRGLCTVRK